MQFADATHSDEGADDKGPQSRHGPGHANKLVGAGEQLHHFRALDEENDRREDEYAEQVGVPREEDGAFVDDVEALLDYDGVRGRDCRARDTAADADEGHGDAIEEDAAKEAHGDDAACE